MSGRFWRYEGREEVRSDGQLKDGYAAWVGGRNVLQHCGGIERVGSNKAIGEFLKDSRRGCPVISKESPPWTA